MGFIDLVSSNWTAPSHVGVFRLDGLHYTFIMISLPDVTQNVFSLDSVERSFFNCRIKARVFIETNRQYSDRRTTQISPDSKTKSRQLDVWEMSPQLPAVFISSKVLFSLLCMKLL